MTLLALLDLQNLTVQRGGRLVLSVPDLQVYPGEVLAVVGPNGSGKSTLLLTLSQLLKTQTGTMRFNGQPLTTASGVTFRRRIALVLQDPLLLDLTVFENVAIGLRFRNLHWRDVENRVSLWLEKLAITHLRHRPASSLSGGEAQRVSLARAFALQTDLLLLDEPFSALDAPTRTALLPDFQTLLAQSQQTAILVTHDLNEALLLGSRMAVLINGELRQVGSPQQVLFAPADMDVAAFVGVETILPGRVIDNRSGLALISAGSWQLEVPSEVTAPGREVFVCLRPEDLTLWRMEPAVQSSARNHLTGLVTQLIPQGALMRVVVDCGFPVVVLITRASALEMSLAAGSAVAVSFKASAAHLLVR